MKFHEMRDCDAWRAQGLQMNTTSNESCKLYDAALSQYMSWYEIDAYGGLEKTLNDMIASDSNFILGHCLINGLDHIGASKSPYDVKNTNNYLEFNKLVNKVSMNLSRRELIHVKAIQCLVKGDLLTACEHWESILIEHPTDLMALKFIHDTYFYLGYHPQMRDSVAGVLPSWDKSLPLYSLVHGMHSFGLVQSNMFEQAKKTAMKALEMNKNDAWATHTICHYNEYSNQFDSGIKFLRETEENWSVCNLLSSHNYWHLALYHIERSEHNEAIEIFQKNIAQNLSLNRTLDMVDAISLLYRLKLDCCESPLESYWSGIVKSYSERKNDHGYIFNDSHIAMMISACDNDNEKCLFQISLADYLKINSETSPNAKNYLKQLNAEYAEKIFNAIFHFDNGEFSKVVEILYPIRYEIIKIGGSNAQRDIFQQMLIQSALRSDSKDHYKIGLHLLNERISLKPNSNLTKRIVTRFVNKH